MSNKILLVYYSLGGNTETVANRIKEKLTSEGQGFDVLVLKKGCDFNTRNTIEDYKLVFIGSPTYGKGKTPELVLNYLRYLLKDNEFTLPSFSVFGTGDTQWVHYAKAVDEISYHLNKKTIVIKGIKIEQRPTSKKQLTAIEEFVDESLRRINIA